MSQVNLLPPEIRQGQLIRRRTFMVAGAGVAVLVLIALVYFAQVARLSGADAELATQQQKNDALSAEIAQLDQYAQLQSQLQDKQKLVDTVSADEIEWSTALLDVSRVIPDEAALTTMSGQINLTTGTTAGATTIPTTTGTASGLVGQITFDGTALGLGTVATWLDSLKTVPGWENPTATTITQSNPNIYGFSSSVDLSKKALAKQEGATP